MTSVQIPADANARRRRVLDIVNDPEANAKLEAEARAAFAAKQAAPTPLTAADVEPADWTQDDLVLVTRRADGMRRAASFVEDNPQLAALLRYTGLKTLISVSTRTQIEAFIAAARDAGQEMTEWSDDYHGGIEIPFGAYTLRVYAPIDSLGGTPPARRSRKRPTYVPLLGAERTDAGQ